VWQLQAVPRSSLELVTRYSTGRLVTWPDHIAPVLRIFVSGLAPAAPYRTGRRDPRRVASARRGFFYCDSLSWRGDTKPRTFLNSYKAQHHLALVRLKGRACVRCRARRTSTSPPLHHRCPQSSMERRLGELTSSRPRKRPILSGALPRLSPALGPNVYKMGYEGVGIAGEWSKTLGAPSAT
jgi:hypothetical protein